MSEVAGVLLHHVHEDVAYLDGIAVMIDGRPEVVDPGGHLLGMGHLASPRLPCVGDHVGVVDGTVEV